MPLQIVPMIVLLFYVFYQPVSILFTVPYSNNFTFNNYFFEVILKWQTGTVFVLGSMVFGDLLTYITIGRFGVKPGFAYQFMLNLGDNNTVSFNIFL